MSDKMYKTLKFNSDAWVSGELIYKKGEIHNVPNDKGSADRWIRRGAEIIESISPVEVKIESPIEEDTSIKAFVKKRGRKKKLKD